MSDSKNPLDFSEEKSSGNGEETQHKFDAFNSSNLSLDSLKNEKSSIATTDSKNRLIQQSQIFTLTIDCFEEIFEYLSMKELHTFGQTCKAMQQIAGKYFQQNYWAAENSIENDGISVFYTDNEGTTNKRMLTTIFNGFITTISYHGISEIPLRFIESHNDEFKSVNNIYLESATLQHTILKYFKNQFSKLKTIQIKNSTIDGDFHDILLKFCTSMKRLYLQDSHLGSKWLQESYPLLEHLELIPIPSFVELDRFFQQNPTVNSFSTSSHSLWLNRHEFLKSQINVDVLEVKIYRYYTVVTNVGANKNEANDDNVDDDDDDEEYETTDSEDELDDDILTCKSLCALLNQLHDRGFYKRLYLYMPNVKNSDHVVSLRGLEKLCVKQLNESHNLIHFISLKELAILDGSNLNDMEILANNYVNLQYLFIVNATYDVFLPFIRRSVRLKCVKVFPKDKSSFNEDVLNLVQLNEEREKLENARKVIIYVPDNVFLTTKWTINNGNTHLRLIEMKRSDSYEWDQHY